VIRYLAPVSPRVATEPVATVYDEIRREFGALVEPFTLLAASPLLLAGVWRACRATLVAGDVRRDVKEAVAAAVSRANRCGYCVDAHVVMLAGTKAHDAARAIVAADADAIADPDVRRAFAWGAASRTPGAPPPFAPSELPELVGTAMVFHYINRPVTVLLGDSPLPALPRSWRAGARRAAGWWFGRAIARAKPRDLPPLLPAAPLPDDLCWAAPSPPVADALGRWVAAVEHEGARVLPEEVRTCVTARLATWTGADPGLGQTWLASAVAPLSAAAQAAARLTLLTALAPHQVDRDVVGAFRAGAADDAALVAALAWASLAAARRVVRWLVPAPAPGL
jgi:AhpD family alkylhydroperoxidase